MTTTCCELLWLSTLLQDLSIAVSSPYLLFYDNKVVVHIVANLVFNEHINYIDIDCHLVRDLVQSGCIKMASMFSHLPSWLTP